MSREVRQTQSTTEGKPYRIRFNLPVGVTLIDVTITHAQPDNGTPLDLQKIIDSPDAWIYMPRDLTKGRHIVLVAADTNDPKVTPEVRLIVDVVI